MTVWKSPCWPGKGSQHKFHPRCPRGNCALWLCLPRWALCQERLHSSSLAKPLGKQGIARPDQIITWTALLDSWLVVMNFTNIPYTNLRLHKLITQHRTYATVRANLRIQQGVRLIVLGLRFSVNLVGILSSRRLNGQIQTTHSREQTQACIRLGLDLRAT